MKKVLLVGLCIILFTLSAFAVEPNYQVRISTDASGNPEYIGEAIPSVGESNLYWRIIKLTWDGVYCTKVSWADGTDKMDKSWTLKATYNYP